MVKEKTCTPSITSNRQADGSLVYVLGLWPIPKTKSQ